MLDANERSISHCRGATGVSGDIRYLGINKGQVLPCVPNVIQKAMIAAVSLWHFDVNAFDVAKILI